jgi:hypothetical protein
MVDALSLSKYVLQPTLDGATAPDSLFVLAVLPSPPRVDSQDYPTVRRVLLSLPLPDEQNGLPKEKPRLDRGSALARQNPAPRVSAFNHTSPYLNRVYSQCLTATSDKPIVYAL